MQRYFLQTSIGQKRVAKFLRYASVIHYARRKD